MLNPNQSETKFELSLLYEHRSPSIKISLNSSKCLIILFVIILCTSIKISDLLIIFTWMFVIKWVIKDCYKYLIRAFNCVLYWKKISYAFGTTGDSLLICLLQFHDLIKSAHVLLFLYIGLGVFLHQKYIDVATLTYVLTCV